MKRFGVIFLLVVGAFPSAFAEEVAVGLASNFSELSTGSFNPYGGYFKDGAILPQED